MAAVSISTDAECVDRIRHRHAVRPAPEHRAQPRQKLADAERLVDVVVGAEVERGDLFRLAIARRQHDDRHVRPTPDLLDHLLAVHVRQAEIEHHGVGRVRRQQIARPAGRSAPSARRSR